MPDEPARTGPADGSAPDRDAPEHFDEAWEREPERPIFQHPQWLLGVVLVFAVVAIFAGLREPVWFLIGFPAILVLVVWIWVQYRMRSM